jgi:polysaccharide pyruvyl transferase WcaK-like protein
LDKIARILLLGDYSGNNAGHNALLISIITEFINIGRFEFVIPTLKPALLKKRLAFNGSLKLIDVAPWHLSLKFLGLPVLRAIRQADCILLTDNLFYDTNFFNLFKNNLIALRILTAYAKKKNISKPLIYYNGGIGPIHTGYGRKFIRSIASYMDLILLRDQGALKDFNGLLSNKRTRITADSGFNFPLKTAQSNLHVGFKANKSATLTANTVGVCLSYHLLNWLEGINRNGLNKINIMHSIAQLLMRLCHENHIELVIFVTHPKDQQICNILVRGLRESVRLRVIDQNKHSLENIVAIGVNLNCVISDRYHELVMFASAYVPIIGVDYNGKVESLFSSLELGDFLFDAKKFLHRDGDKVLSRLINNLQARRRHYL